MIRTLLVTLVALSFTACSDNAPPPKPKPAAPAPAAAPPVTAAPAPAPAPITKAPEPAPDPNKELAARVKRALEGEAKIQAAGIDVTASDGKVTLWGTAATAGERTRAARAAGKVDGVKSVENKIAVVKGS